MEGGNFERPKLLSCRLRYGRNIRENPSTLTFQVATLPRPPGFGEAPTNANGRQTLMCVNDLVACCETQGLGNWYYPGGAQVTGGSGATFRTNRGQNVEDDQSVNGSVRIWRYYTPPERGVFRCELSDASGVNQSRYVNICEFQSN